MGEPVSLARDGAAAVITIDTPTVNALGAAVRAGLVSAFAAAAADAATTAIVLGCAGRTFVCQSAGKKDPRSASKRDPLGTAGRSKPRASAPPNSAVATERLAAVRLDF